MENKVNLESIRPVCGYGIVRLHEYVKEDDFPEVFRLAKQRGIEVVETVHYGVCLYVHLNTPDDDSRYGYGELKSDFFECIGELLREDSEYDYSDYSYEDIELESFVDICIDNKKKYKIEIMQKAVVDVELTEREVENLINKEDSAENLIIELSRELEYSKLHFRVIGK